MSSSVNLDAISYETMITLENWSYPGFKLPFLRIVTWGSATMSPYHFRTSSFHTFFKALGQIIKRGNASWNKRLQANDCNDFPTPI